MTDNKRNIRGIDDKLYHEARMAALKSKQTVGQWMNEAIYSKLHKWEKK